MKRYSGLHDKLCTIENIEVADDNARKNKNKKFGIGVPIGNYLSQYFANLYLSELNHFPINFKITKYDWRIYTKNRKENIKPQI